VTGCLQNRSMGDFYDRYIEDGEESSLVEDVDLLADEWEDGILASVCSLAIRCIQTKREKRPKTIELVEEMGRLVSQTHHNVGGFPTASCGGNMGRLSSNENAELCFLCAKLSTPVSICQNHSTCQQCFEDHVHMHLGEMTIQCPIIGCDNHFSNTDMYKSQILPSNLYELHLKKQTENDNWSKLFQDQKEILKQITRVASQLSRTTQALANLTAGVDAKCPRIVYIVPLNEKREPIWKWPKNLIKTEVQIFFVCQHSFDVVTETCITTKVTKQWVTCIAPAIKCAMSLLRAAVSAGLVTTGIHFPIESMEKFVLDMIVDPLTKELIARTEEFLTGISATQNNSILELDRKKLTEIVGASYEVISQKAQKDQHSEWKNHLVPVLDHAGSIIWVKKKFQGLYQ